MLRADKQQYGRLARARRREKSSRAHLFKARKRRAVAGNVGQQNSSRSMLILSKQ